jgi:hypothetical protein
LNATVTYLTFTTAVFNVAAALSYSIGSEDAVIWFCWLELREMEIHGQRSYSCPFKATGTDSVLPVVLRIRARLQWWGHWGVVLTVQGWGEKRRGREREKEGD